MTGRSRLRRILMRRTLSFLVASALVCTLTPTMASETPADLAVWQIVNEKKTSGGTAFAVGKRHFLTNAHVIAGFIKHHSKRIVLRQRGHANELTVNYRNLALFVAYDLALFTTREEIKHVLRFADREKTDPGTRLRIIGYPEGQLAIARQSEGTIYENSRDYTVPMGRWVKVGGFSGSPLLDRNDRVMGVVHSADDNMASVVKVERIYDLLDRKVLWTACRDYTSLMICFEAAVEATTRAAETGDVLAQYALGWQNELPGYIEWLTRAAEQGFADAQAQLADRYRIDKEDWHRAAHWYERAATQGHPTAPAKLSNLYYNGEGVEPDPVRAFHLLRESARAGYVAAQYNLGVVYLKGMGTSVDRSRAAHWLEKAADNGYDDARRVLDELNRLQ